MEEAVFSCPSLASLINNTLKDKIFARYRYNQMFTDYLKQNNQDLSNNILTFSSPQEGFNLTCLFILTASASELIISSLNPFIKVILIGTKTVGKNVASLLYTLKGQSKSYTFFPLSFSSLMSIIKVIMLKVSSLTCAVLMMSLNLSAV